MNGYLKKNLNYSIKLNVMKSIELIGIKILPDIKRFTKKEAE